VKQLAKSTSCDQLPSQGQCRHASVIETHHAHDTLSGNGISQIGHGLRLRHSVGEGLLAQDVLAGAESYQGTLGVGESRYAQIH
jgi:hypothetical protein